MTLQQKLKRVGDALVAGFTVTENDVSTVTVPVYHYWRSKKTAPFIVWAEDGEGDNRLQADDHKAEQSIDGYVDYYTKTEYDTNIDTIQTILDGITGFPFGWRLDSVQYEEDTNLIHYQWVWSMA